jgi:hypothetical protein
MTYVPVQHIGKWGMAPKLCTLHCRHKAQILSTSWLQLKTIHKKQFVLNVKGSFWHLIQKHYHQLHKNWTHDNNPCENREISILTISKARTSLKAFPWGKRKTSRYKELYRQEKETTCKGWTKLKKHKLVRKKVRVSHLFRDHNHVW